MRSSSNNESRFEHPFDLTESKIRRIAEQLLPRTLQLNTKSVIATGAIRVIEVSHGINVTRGHMRGVRCVDANVSTVPGLQIEGRLVGRSTARETMPPHRSNDMADATISVSGFPEESHWTVKVPAQPELETATIAFPLAYLESLHETEPEFSALALSIVKESSNRQRPLCGRQQVLFTRMMATDPDEPGGKLLIESLCLSVLFETLRELQAAKSVSCSPAISCLEGVIEERLKNPPTISELSQMLRMSESSLKREFLQSTGQSIGSFITRRRMEMAKELMASGLPISRVSYEVGYATAQSFSKAFRRQFGFAPREFCKQSTMSDQTLY